MYEDVYDRKQDLERQLDDETLRFEDRRNLSQTLRKIYEVLGEEEDAVLGEDPLIDKWEQELEAGITPDLDER